MADNVLPTIGSSGFFELRAPFNNAILPNEQYTCQAVRKLSDYLANNEDPKAEIYDKYEISGADYEKDIADDVYIVSLQAEVGHWVYVPAKYVVKYPIVNGIPYRTVMLGVSLPAVPVAHDLSFLLTDIQNLVKDTLGVASNAQVVETSKVILVSKDKHDISLVNRAVVANGRSTDRSRYISTLNQLNNANAKIAALEAYIKAKL